MAFLMPVLLVVVLLGSLVLTLLGLPGNWVMVVIVAAYAFWAPADWAASIGWQTVGAVVVLAILGEIVELLAGAAGTARAGGSRRGTLLAILGSLVGGIAGIFVGLPIPVVGSLVAAVVFAGVGAMAGAMAGEFWVGKDFDDSLRVGKGAFWGRVLGTMGKMVVGGIMVVVVVLGMLF